MNLKPYALILLLSSIIIIACTHIMDQPSEKKESHHSDSKLNIREKEIDFALDSAVVLDYERISLDSLPEPRVVPFSLIIDTLTENLALSNNIPAKISSTPIDEQALRHEAENNRTPLPLRVPANGDRIHIETESRSVNFVPSISALKPQMKSEANLDIQYWTEDEGLPSALITDLLEDRRGNIWIGTTDNGVSRFDGSYFTHFSTQETWNGKWIYQLLEDEDGNIWITSRSDIRSYDGKQYTIYPWNQKVNHFLEQKEGHLWLAHRDSGLIYQNEGRYLHFHKSNGLHSHSIRGVFIDQDLHSWLYGAEGVSRFDGTHFTHYTPAEGLIDRDVKQVIEDQKGRYYFLTAKGISRLDDKGFTNFSSDFFFQNNQLNHLAEDRQGNIWVSSNNGLFYMTDKEVFHYTIESPSEDQKIYNFWLDEENRITFKKGNSFVQFDGKAFVTVEERNGLNVGIRMSDLIVDRQSQVWAGSLPGGISRYKPNGFKHFGKKEGLSGERAWTFEEDQNGNIWIGTLDDGISVFTEKGVIHLGEEQGLLDNTIRAITEDSKGNIWIGSSLGLTKFDGRSLSFFTQAQGIDEVEQIMEDSKGRLWVGTSQKGLFVFDEAFIQHYSKDRYPFNYFFEDSKGRVWTKIPFEPGVMCFQDNRFLRLSSDQDIPNKEVHSITEDSRGIIWLGTHQGLYYLNDQGFRLIESNVALANDNIVSIVEDPDGRLWVATNEGLHLLIIDKGYPKSNDRNIKFFFFGKSDGIRDFDFSYNATLVDSQNRIWWGRLRRGKGVMMAHLDAFEIEETAPQSLHLSDVYINQQFIDFHQLTDSVNRHPTVLGNKISYDSVASFYNYPVGLTLPYRLNHLTFFFSALDWAAPHKIKYQYKIEGLDQGWSEPQAEPFADYRNIPPGEHILRIRAMSSTQKWGAPVEYRFRVRPPWWETTAAYLFYGLSAIGLIWLGINWRLRYMRLSYEKDTAETKARLAAEANEAKSNFLSTISHELRTPLTSIIGFAKINKKNLKEKVLPNIPDDHKKMKRSAQRNFSNLDIMIQEGQRLADLINELLDLSKIESGKVVWKMESVQPNDLIQHAINATSSLFTQKTEVELKTEIPSPLPSVSADQNRILQVLINLISNAVKFTESGQILIGVEDTKAQTEERVTFFVQDSGMGIPKNYLDQVFEKFKQVEDHQSGKPKGTGLGLPICKEILEAHRGEIWVESEEGKGSTFFFTLPTIEKEVI